MKNATFLVKKNATTALILLIGSAMLILSSCKKDGGGVTTPNSKSSLLAGGKWTLQKVEQQQKDGSWLSQPLYPTPSTVEFHDDKTFAATTNGSTGVGTWRLSDDLSQLVLTNTSTAKTYDILQLTSSVLQLTPAGYAPTDYMHERDTYGR